MIGVLLLLAVFGFYAYLAMPLTGGFATLLLATLPGFFTFCRSSMSEISASALVILAFMFAYLGLKEEHRWKIYLSALFLGLSVNIRIQSLFFAPLLLAMALFPARGMRWRWFFHCARIGVSIGVRSNRSFLFATFQPTHMGCGRNSLCIRRADIATQIFLEPALTLSLRSLLWSAWDSSLCESRATLAPPF